MEILKLLKTVVKGGFVVLLPFVFSVIMSLLCFAGVALLMSLEDGSFYSHFVEAINYAEIFIVWFIVGVFVIVGYCQVD